MTVELCCSPCRARLRVVQGVWSPPLQLEVAANVSEAKDETSRVHSIMSNFLKGYLKTFCGKQNRHSHHKDYRILKYIS